MSITSIFRALLPWDFSPATLAVVVLAAVAFARGAAASGSRPERTRAVAFYAGLTLIYAALQTQWDYYAGHMFFVHRLQHFALHDVGPLLLAFSAPAALLVRGTPTAVRDALRPLKGVVRPIARVLFEPWTATVLFVGSLVFWVVPSIHFYAMVSNWVYTLMNWSVLLLDLPFWWLIFDPRPYPAARLGQGTRILMLVFVMGPMILTGAIISLVRHDIYPVYQICGRFLPISPLTDQQIGGLIIWIPGSLLTVFAALICLRRAMYQSDARERMRLQAMRVSPSPQRAQ
jgi:putative membrane protein